MMQSKRFATAVLLFFLLIASAFADITLHFTSWDGDESMKVIRKAVKIFEQQNPGVHVQIESISDYNLYHQKMVVRYAANDAPDVAMMDPSHFLALAKRGALLPLNQFFNENPGFNIKDYYKPIVEAHSYEGQLYVLPRDIAPTGIIYYNKKIFQEAGLPYPDGTWTWDFKERPELKNKDFLWVMHRLTEFEANGKVKRYGFLPALSQLFFNTLGYSYGLYYVDNGQAPTKFLTDSPDWIKVANFMIDLQYKKQWTPGQQVVASQMQVAPFQLFIQGKTAMYQNGIWDVPQIRKYMSPTSKSFFDWDICLFPAYAGKPLRMATGGSGYCIFSSTKYPKEAWKLTSFMAGPVGMRLMAEAGIAQPAMRKIALSDAWLPGPNTPLDQQYPHNRIITDTAVPTVEFDPTSELWPDAGGVLNAKLDNLWNNVQPPAVVLKVATEQAQARLDYLRKQQDLPKLNWPAAITIGVAIFAILVGWIYWPERHIKYSKRQKQENLAAYKFLFPWLFGMLTLTIGPMILSLLMSTSDWDMILPARWRGVGNYVEAVTVDPRFWVSLKVTFIYTFLSVPLGLVIAFFMALLLNQKVRGIPLFRTFFYIPSLVSAVAASLVWQKLLAPDQGLVNAVLYNKWVNKIFHLGDFLSSYAGTPHARVDWLGNEKTALLSFVVMSLWGVGGSMIILLAGLQGIPTFYYEAATMDGASPAKRMRAVTLPLLTPSIFFALITGVIGAFQTFTQVYTVTNGAGGPNNSTMLYMLNLYIAGFSNYRFGYVASLSWVLFLIILVFTLLQFNLNRFVYYESSNN